MLLSEHIEDLPIMLQRRYSGSGKFIKWTNALLEELSGRGAIKDVNKEIGAVVKNGVWIDKPVNMVSLFDVFSPLSKDVRYRIEFVNKRLKLLECEFPETESVITGTYFDEFSTGGLIAAIGLFEEGDLEKHLLVVTGGTFAGRTYLISGNDETTEIPYMSGTAQITELYFLDPLISAFTETQVTSVAIVSPEDYVMLKYSVLFDPIDSESDEVPIPDNFERRLVPAWLRWKCELDISSVSKETVFWDGEVRKQLTSVGAESTRYIPKSKGRKLTGFMGRR